MQIFNAPHCFLAVFLSMLITFGVAPSLQADPVAAFTDRVGIQIEKYIAARNENGGFVCGGEPICGVSLIPSFYEQRQYAPIWLDTGGLRPTAQALIRTIVQAGRDGLNPADYHLTTIEALLADLEKRLTVQSTGQEVRWAELELLLTDAFLLLSSHLSGGRVNPQTLHTDWLLSQHTVDVMAVLDEVVTEAQLDRAVDQLRPPHAGYAELRNALQQLRDLDQAGGWPQVAAGPTLRPENRDPRVLTLRHRLAMSGDLQAEEQNFEAPDYFDEHLSEALRRFQRRHGLEPDGLAGRLTIEALNVPAKQRMRQIELNLERWRWLPDDLGDRHIWINTADFNLRVVEDRQAVLQMRVVVGRPARRTPVFSSQMTYLVINPYWTVPFTISVEDLLPRVIADPDYFERQSIKVYYGWEEGTAAIDPRFIDWRAYNKKQFPFRLVQEPGASNALGRIKFMFPNRFAVYLHDTPHRTHFGRNQRDFSSGCIRVENAVGLATYLLQDNPGWTTQAIQTAIDAERQQVVLVKNPIPVHLIYMTAWVDEKNVLQFRNDIYRRDADLDTALKTRPHSAPPQLELFVPQETE